MSELVLLLSAELDIQQAFAYYEDYQEGRGTVFLQHLEAAFEQLGRFPESGARFRHGYRRLLVPRFPYGIFYTLEARGVVVTCVIDTRQDPASILRRLA